jgi:sterol desaturase/sphingolipid hydroxylase (fatty acid hydroxylase superfamily)
MQLLDTNGYYALGIPLYLTIIGVEIALARKQGIRVYRFADTLGNFSAGLEEIVIGLFLGPLLLWLYDFGYAQLALINYVEGSPLPWILAFLCGDFCYYIYHRSPLVGTPYCGRAAGWSGGCCTQGYNSAWILPYS